MSFEKDNQLKDAYALFDRGHGRLRRELLARLAQEHAASPGNDPPPNPSLGHLRIGNWILGTAIGVAAMLVVGATAWQLLSPPDPTARMSLLSSHIQTVKSLYIRGWYAEPQN